MLTEESQHTVWFIWSYKIEETKSKNSSISEKGEAGLSFQDDEEDVMKIAVHTSRWNLQETLKYGMNKELFNLEKSIDMPDINVTDQYVKILPKKCFPSMMLLLQCEDIQMNLFDITCSHHTMFGTKTYSKGIRYHKLA